MYINAPIRNNAVVGINGEIIKFATKAIGAWNMDATAEVNVNMGAGISYAIAVGGWISNDAADKCYPIHYTNAYAETDLSCYHDSANGANVITLKRRSPGFFDSADFDNAVDNRGYVWIAWVDWGA